MNAPTPLVLDRSKFLGGSDAAAVLGVSPWRTPLDLYLDKIQPAKEDVSVDRHRAAALNRGKRLEPYVLDMLEQEHGIASIERNARYIDPEHRFLACEIDAETLYGENVANIEVKTVHPFKVKEWGEVDTDSIPVHYTAQAMHGLMVTGRERCIFAVLIGDELRLYNVDRDDETIVAMRDREVAFWNDHVLARVPPEAISSSDMVKLFAKDAGSAVEATPELAELVGEIRHLKTRLKEGEQLVEEKVLRLQLYMAEAATLTFEGRAIATWKTQSATRFSQSEFSAAHPGLFEQFKRTSETRVLRIK